MSHKALLVEQADTIQRAAKLIQLGARMQVLEDLTPMPREKLLRLYKEVKGVAPPRGMLPFSTDWFLEWQPSIHSALYLAQRNEMRRLTGKTPKELLPDAYRKYLESVSACGMEPVLSMTRAWSLERFMAGKMLKEIPCKKCGGLFLAHAHDLDRGFVCGLCKMPPRAGKTLKGSHGSTASATAI